MDLSSYFIVFSLIFIQVLVIQIYIQDFVIGIVLTTVIGLVIVAGAFKLEKYLDINMGFEHRNNT